MKRKILIAVLVLAAAIACGARIHFVNVTAEKPSREIVYSMGREAPLGRDVFFGKGENVNGYFVTVTSAKIISLSDFLKKYHLKPDFLKEEEKELGPGSQIDFVYEVKVHIRNQDNTLYGKTGIDLKQWSLLATDYWTQIQSDLYAAANPFVKGGSLTFSMKPGTSRDFVLPYSISSQEVNLDYLKQNHPSVIVSAYPERKLLRLR